jgi:hypothetical protein
MAAGCSTVPDPYIPTKVGSFDARPGVNDLVVEIDTDRNLQPLGAPLTFVVTIRNTGSQAYWIPRKPLLLFYWIYPTGQRDNYVIDFPPERYYAKDEVFLLAPGQTYSVLEHIETYYFPKPGITEFKVMFYSANNTNREWTPFWHGKIFSNNYGVRLLDRLAPVSETSLSKS